MHDKLTNSELGYSPYLGDSRKMREFFRMVNRISQYSNYLLIAGETGIGKEMIARTLHHRSRRASHPFICVTCNPSRSTIESEMFGVEKGILPGVSKTQKGKLESANKGTIFIDEVSQISLEAQAKLLRFLERREVKRVGGLEPIYPDVWVIAVSSKDLSENVASGTFLKDLYDYLDAIKCEIPPLRSRKHEIPFIVEYYLNNFAEQAGVKPKNISQNALDLLIDYDWPGNVMELENIVEKAFIFSRSDVLCPRDFPECVNKENRQFLTLIEMEKKHITSALIKTRGNKTKAASLLGISRSTLYNKIDYLTG
jgi:DNA-binding NtrC family response regulator